MARAFTEAEKSALRERLLVQGRALFTSIGLKKTVIEDLTAPLGIAKSSFYLFFDSKEALYMALLAAEGPEIEARIRRAAFQPSHGAAEILEHFIRAVFDELETNALTRRLLTHPEELELLARRQTPEQLTAKMQTISTLTRELIARAGSPLTCQDPELLGLAIRALTMVAIHQRELGPRYAEARDLLIRGFVRGSIGDPS